MRTRQKTYQQIRSTLRRGLVCLWALFLVMTLNASGLFQAGSAFAITENTEAELTETQERIERSAAAYDEAVANIETIEKEIEKTQAEILELEASIAEQKQKSDEAIVWLYKWTSDGFPFINLILNAGSLQDFIISFEYLTRVQQSFYDEIMLLESLKQGLEEVNASLEEMKKDAKKEMILAEEALLEAQAAREEAQRKAEEEAAAEAEAAARAIALAQAQENAETSEADPNTDTGNNSNSGNSISDVDWSSDKATFVEEWGARIDAYFAGYPLAGQGRTFAAAAWDYGVDPRYSPAISHTESTRGLYCFRSYNAWGWGQYSWSSWEEAIYAHVGGLSRGYSYTICLADAKKYCENWEHWYNTTLKQMNMI